MARRASRAAARYGAGSMNGGRRRSSRGRHDQRRETLGVDRGHREDHVGGADRALRGRVAGGPGAVPLLRRERRLGQQIGNPERRRRPPARASPATCGRRDRSARRAGAVSPASGDSGAAAGRRAGRPGSGCALPHGVARPIVAAQAARQLDRVAADGERPHQRPRHPPIAGRDRVVGRLERRVEGDRAIHAATRPGALQQAAQARRQPVDAGLRGEPLEDPAPARAAKPQPGGGIADQAPRAPGPAPSGRPAAPGGR